MGRAVILSIPFHGHVNPTLAVVQELVARGEEVIYYSSDPFKERLEHVGALFRRYDSRFTDEIMHTSATDFAAFLIEEALHVIPQMLEEIRAAQPDYIIYDTLCLSGRCIARALDLPAVMLFTTHAAGISGRVQKARKTATPPVTMAHLPAAAPQPGEPQQDVLIVRGNGRSPFPPGFRPAAPPQGPGTATATPAQPVARPEGEDPAKTYNLPLTNPSEVFDYAEPLNIVFVPRAFQVPVKTFDDSYVFVGPSIRPETMESSPVTRSPERPTLYISLGTVNNEEPQFFKQCLEVFGNTEWQVIMSIGERLDIAQLGEIPANISVAPHHPQLAVLPNTDVFITHGGMNSTLEALSHGIPLVVIAQMPEQTVTAERVAELGIGISLDKFMLTSENLREAVYRVHNEPSFRQEAAKMQVAIKESGGAKQAADEILRYSAARDKAPALDAAGS